MIDEMKNLLDKHENWRKDECINMIASENRSLETAQEMYNSDLMHRYAEGEPFNRYYRGTKYLDRLEILVDEAMQDLFGVDNIELRALSGTMANMAVYKALKDTGIYFDSRISDGSHVSHTKFGSAGIFGLKERNLVFDYDRLQIDPVKSAKKINREDPDFIILGKSLFLFPEPIEELREEIEVDTKIVYDAAHVLGLIAGNKFQASFEEGADIITSSTHKTFPGPQGGLVMSKSKHVHKKIKKAMFPGLTCSWHSHRLGHLGATAVGMKKFGEEYAGQIIDNAQKLAETLNELGFDVLGEKRGFTKSHTLAVDVIEQGGGKEVSKKLEENNIILNKNAIPGESFTGKEMHDPDGIRIGTQEMTLLGMEESEMVEIAHMIRDVLMNGKDVTDRVKELREEYDEVHYSL